MGRTYSHRLVRAFSDMHTVSLVGIADRLCMVRGADARVSSIPSATGNENIVYQVERKEDNME